MAGISDWHTEFSGQGADHVQVQFRRHARVCAGRVADEEVVEAERQVLRDLPPLSEAALAQLGDTEVIAAYTPPEIE